MGWGPYWGCWAQVESSLLETQAGEGRKLEGNPWTKKVSREGGFFLRRGSLRMPEKETKEVDGVQ